MSIEIVSIRAFKDNYIWVGRNKKNNAVFIVDPGDAVPVLDFFEKNTFMLSAILVTHKHSDHCGGVPGIIQKYPVPVFGPYINDHEKIYIYGFEKSIDVIAIPGHTLEHVAYYAPGILFCGDTLFTGGCGRLFEGTPAQMVNSLNKLMALPDDTLIYCGHEYTQKNLAFAKLVEPNNILLKNRIEKASGVPATIQEEKQTNPFLRCHHPEVIQSVENYVGRKLSNPIEVFEYLRKWKDNF